MVAKIITGRYVLGEFHHKGEWHRGSHPSHIDADKWATAQQVAQQSRRYTPKGGGRIPALRRLAELRATLAGLISRTRSRTAAPGQHRAASGAAASGDIGARRSVIAAVFSNFSIVPENWRFGPNGDPDMTKLMLVPTVRPEMLMGWDVIGRDQIDPKNDGQLRRVPIPFGLDAEGSNNQHGTELWKYMTQNTFRRS